MKQLTGWIAALALLFAAFTPQAGLAQPTVDGDLSESDYTWVPNAESETGFSSANVIDSLGYAVVGDSVLYVAQAGTLEANRTNGYGLLLDVTGESNSPTGLPSGDGLGIADTTRDLHFLDGDGSALSVADSVNNNFTADFEVDYATAIGPFDAASPYDTTAAFWADYTGSSSSATSLGQTDQSGTSATGGGITYAFLNSENSDTGAEWKIPLDEIGASSTNDLQVFTFIASNTGYFSNAILPGDGTASAVGNAGDGTNPGNNPKWDVIAGSTGDTYHALLGGGGNSAPVASDDSFSTTEGQTLSVNAPGVLDNDSDPDGDSLSASLVSGVSNGSLTFNPDGSFEYTPDPNHVGPDSLTYEVSDGNATDQALVTINVTPPVVETEPNPARTDSSVTIYFNADGGDGGLEDHSGDVYAHTGISTDQTSSGTWKCLKNYWPADSSFTANRTDTKLSQVSTNRYELVVDSIRTYYQDTSTNCDLGSGEAIQTMNFVFRNADGSKTGKAVGGADIFVDVNDVVSSDSNSAPVAEADSFSTTEGQTLSVNAPGVLDNDSDPDGDSLSASVTEAPLNGTVTLDPNGSFTYAPSPRFAGTDQFSYEVSDGSATDQATVTIAVDSSGPSPGPMLATVADYEDLQRDSSASGGTTIQPVQSVVSSASNGVTSLEVNASGSGTVTFERRANLPTSDRLRFLLKPDPDSSFTLTFTFVEEANGSEATYDVSVAVDSGDTWRKYVIPFSDLGTSFNPVASRAGGNGPFLRLEASANEAVTYHLDELEFGTKKRGLVELMDFDRTTLAYGPPFCPPAFDSTASVAAESDGFTARSVEGSGCFGYNYEGLFVDAEGSDVVSFLAKGSVGDSLYVFLETREGEGGFAFESGMTVPLPVGSWGRVEVPIDALGDDPTALRRAGLSNVGFEAQGTAPDFLIDDVKIRAPSGNLPPLAAADNFTAIENQTLNVSAPGVLGNDTDPNLDSLSVSLVSDVSNGTLSLDADGSFTYTPDSSYTGSDSFTYEVSDDSNATDQATVSLEVQTETTRTLALVDGWNLASIPLDVSDPSFGSVLPSCQSGFAFEAGQGYAPFASGDPVPPGVGFFAKCSADSVDVTGLRPDTATADVSRGWNVVGPFADTVDVSAVGSSPSGIVASSFYGFSQTQGYQAADSLRPGQGYWVQAGESGTLDFSGTTSSAAPALLAAKSADESSAKQIRLVVRDAQGRSTTLHLAPTLSEQQMKRHALPPKPPSGLFDVRFATGRSAATFEKEDSDAFRAVELQGAAYPIELRLRGASAGQSVQFRRESGAAQTLTTESPSATLQKSNDPLQLNLESVPTTFALKKGYPNPASGPVTIEYGVPEATQVSIEVYDVLGRRVARLVDGQKKAGSYTTQIEAGRLSSGTYFYRMRAGDFQQTRRMVIVE